RHTSSTRDWSSDVCSSDLPNQRTRRVILPSVSSRVSHVPDLRFIQVRQLVLLRLRPEPQLVNVVNNLPQVVAALNLVFDLSKNRSEERRVGKDIRAAHMEV